MSHDHYATRRQALLDSDAGAAVYTDDAEWINAFGDWVQGRENIV